jgi:hypothetical protein
MKFAGLDRVGAQSASPSGFLAIDIVFSSLTALPSLFLNLQVREKVAVYGVGGC